MEICVILLFLACMINLIFSKNYLIIRILCVLVSIGLLQYAYQLPYKMYERNSYIASEYGDLKFSEPVRIIESLHKQHQFSVLIQKKVFVKLLYREKPKALIPMVQIPE